MRGFRAVLSESQAVEDLTHEALTHHGFEIDGPSRRSYSKGGDGGENDVYDTSYHQSLSDAGWKVHHHFSYKEHPDGEDHDEYSHDENSPHAVYDNRIWHHPDHPDKSLTTQDVSWSPELNDNLSDWTKHYVRFSLKGREAFQ